jgi:hypothetical protein
MEAVRTSETSDNFYKTTRRNIKSPLRFLSLRITYFRLPFILMFSGKLSADSLRIIHGTPTHPGIADWWKSNSSHAAVLPGVAIN